MSAASLLDKTAVIVRRDVLTAVRYRTGFLLGGAAAITELAKDQVIAAPTLGSGP